MKMTSKRRALDKIHRRRHRYEIPDWQREDVWDEGRKQKLIDSILRGWRLPKFYFLLTNDDPEQFEVVDGQQRLLAIWEFFDNELVLSSNSDSLTNGARQYRDLSDHLQDRFVDYEIDYDQIEDASDEDIKEFFQRLQEGLPLTSSEKLNSVHGNLRDFCLELSQHDYFRNKTSVSPRRYGYFDIVAKVAALQVDGIRAGLRYDDLKHTFESQRSFSSDSLVADRLRQTVDTLDLIFPNKDSRLRNRTIVQSLCTLVASMSSIRKAQERRTDIREFVDLFLDELGRQVELGQDATDQSYVQFQRTVNANIRSGPATRQQILVRKLMIHNPTLRELFSAEEVAASRVDAEIERLGVTIGSMITRLNDDYEPTHGKDLFKMTNRTLPALLRLGEPIADLDGYRQLIDDLYFLLYEGSGTRLDAKPEVFRDVQLLRTDLAHDVDHGSQSEVARKRRNIGTVFAKYAGSPSPRTVAPEQLAAIQGRILAAVLAALEDLSWPGKSGT